MGDSSDYVACLEHVSCHLLASVLPIDRPTISKFPDRLDGSLLHLPHVMPHQQQAEIQSAAQVDFEVVSQVEVPIRPAFFHHFLDYLDLYFIVNVGEHQAGDHQILIAFPFSQMRGLWSDGEE